MDKLERLQVLGSAARFDVCAATFCGVRPRRLSPLRSLEESVIYRAVLPDAGTVSLFKVLQTNACRHNCFYCANRAERGHRRTRFRPEELAALFMDFHERDCVQGLFLSSGVEGSPARTMQDMLKTAEIVRTRYGFGGYVHLKVLPGAPYDCVERAVELANRVSVNMEAPTEAQLARIAPDKHMPGDVIQRMHWIRRAAAARSGAMASGQTTQFIVGAGRETDREILNSANALYRDVGLRRAYFSAFQPVSDTPLEERPPAPPMREHRLYQVDWLLRQYDGIYALGDVVFEPDGNLALTCDPKLSIALSQREHFPIEVNRADYGDLLRVPGIGPKSARRIVRERKLNRFADAEELRRMGVVVKRAAPFLLVNGREAGDLEAFALRHMRHQRPSGQLVLPLG